MTGRIIDGKAFAARLKDTIAAQVTIIKDRYGFTPGLAVIIVGEDPASQVYVRNKNKSTLEAGMNSYEHHLDENVTEKELLTLIERLNNDPDVHGILCQLPLPKHINEDAVINTVIPAKDVDGFHVINSGLLATGGRGMVPCTPLGCIMMLKDEIGSLRGLDAVVVGRSNIVGKPMGQLLLDEDCTVTTAHRHTKDLAATVRRADIVVVAVGVPELVKGDWIKKGATVIDVGINRIKKETPEGEKQKYRLIGDVEFKAALENAAAITPVPGGVGPMTIGVLLKNTVSAACRQHHVDEPEI
jgi:methylenetetrahydrofolate dehydrogenase (NADP+)/methenyltetrahydrofolate cyclohydrolase